MKFTTWYLGEAEIIWLIENREGGATFVSDDRPAADYGARRGLAVMDSRAILATCYAKGYVGCPEAYDLLVAMSYDHQRGVHVPRDHTAVC